jgi:hypothetical protein
LRGPIKSHCSRACLNIEAGAGTYPRLVLGIVNSDGKVVPVE